VLFWSACRLHSFTCAAGEIYPNWEIFQIELASPQYMSNSEATDKLNLTFKPYFDVHNEPEPAIFKVK
jgi:hypothetical protein